MKVIDLLNKIANEKEVPKEIVLYSERFKFTGYDSACKNYQNELEDLFDILDGSMLNKEVEILEEKKIPEKLNEELASSEDMLYKINEIVDYLDYLKSKGE